MNIPAHNHPEPVELTPSVTFQWLKGGQAFLIKITSSKQSDIDAYSTANIHALEMWDKSRNFYSIQDVSHPDVTLTPYFRERLDQITIHVKDSGLKGHSVIILNNTILGRTIQLYGRIFARKAEPIYQYWVLSEKRALEQLDKLMAQHG